MPLVLRASGEMEPQLRIRWTRDRDLRQLTPTRMGFVRPNERRLRRKEAKLRALLNKAGSTRVKQLPPYVTATLGNISICE